MPERGAESTERTAGRAIRIDGQPFETRVWAGVEVESALTGAACHPHARGHLCAGVHDATHGDSHRGAVLPHTEAQVSERRLPIPSGNKLFGAAVFQAHGASRLPREQGHQHGEATLVLVTKATTHAGTDDTHL